MFKNKRPTRQIALGMSVLNTLLFHLPFFDFANQNSTSSILNRLVLLLSLLVVMLSANFFAFYLLLSLSRRLGKIVLSLFFILNSISVYFIQIYHVLVDESMIANVLNTNFEESSSFFSFKLVLYILFLGIAPSVLLFRLKIEKEAIKTVLLHSGLALGIVLVLVLLNAKNILWIDHNSKQLGGLAMPWSYTVNTSLFYVHQAQKNKKEILLPDAQVKNEPNSAPDKNEKAIVVLVIGESARQQNFSLYGYTKNTNPLLSQTENVFAFKANSSATYTTAGVKSILEYKDTDELYEILPNYLARNQVDVIWKTTNWGEPPVHIANYQSKEALREKCIGDACAYDEILLTGLRDDILASTKDRIFIVLHTSTSHGPTYNTKYPPQFEVFTPVCTSVELANCSQEELHNAYDNTLVYTDYLLHRVIEELKAFPTYKRSMLFVSDHGESLGENKIYMHGLPLRLAPKEQYEIPFIVWVGDGNQKLKPIPLLSQHHVFHSVLHFLNLDSPIYDEKMNIFQ